MFVSIECHFALYCLPYPLGSADERSFRACKLPFFKRTEEYLVHQLAVVQAIVDATPQGQIVPSSLDPTVHRAVTKAVAKAAMTSGIAQKDLDEEYFDVEEKM